MSVVLDAVKFNHDPGAISADAINLRRNATQVVAVPEWRNGVSLNPEDSPAAYAQNPTRGNTLTIQAQFHRSDPQLTTVRIRAVDADLNPPEPRGCLGILVWLLLLLLRALSGNVLGRVRARTVYFPGGGQTGFETFELTNVRLWKVGVGVHTTTWRWQYRKGRRQRWTDFATTTHRIYVLLDVPTAPWQQIPYQPNNLQLPWTDVLDHSCRWAAPATTPDDAAARITRSVYDLGPQIVTYDCPGGGSTHYASPGFDCTAFLDRLRGGIGNGQYVNCTDCATIVSTFANAVGVDLWQSEMGYFFALNPILAIGSPLWEPACLSSGYGWTGSFSYHEVAWEGACQAADAVFDGCLQVDGDSDPTAPPQTPLLPTNLRFGNPGTGDYRDRLATPAGRATCNPQPTTRTRRSVF
jgi:hypothetical protein